MIIIKMPKSIFITLLLCMIFLSSALASIIQRIIIINGSFGDQDSAATVTALPNANVLPGTHINTNPAKHSSSGSNNPCDMASDNAARNLHRNLLSIIKIPDASSGHPLEVINYTSTLVNMGAKHIHKTTGLMAKA